MQFKLSYFPSVISATFDLQPLTGDICEQTNEALALYFVGPNTENAFDDLCGKRSSQPVRARAVCGRPAGRTTSDVRCHGDKP